MSVIKEIIETIFADKVDGVSFIPSNIELDLDIRGFTYNSKRVKYESADIGYRYHILLYRMTPEGTIIDVDHFDAILTGPEVYVTNIINSGFFGMVTKKTKGNHSKQFVNKLMKKLKEYSI